MQDLISIVYTCNTSFRYWTTDPIWLHNGETAKVFGFWIADDANPLYKVRRDRDGDEKAIPKCILLKYGTIAPD